MFLTESKRKRVPFTWIDFSDNKNGQSGFAKDWYFWVQSAFKPALDIYHLEQIDAVKTRELREKKCQELFGMTHQELKKDIAAAKEKLTKSERHLRIMAHSHKVLLETQGSPLVFTFRATDSLESKCGDWYVQVTQDNSGTEKAKGHVGFNIYARNIELNTGGIWKKKGWFSTTQADFVNLLRTGHCDVLDLDNPFFPTLEDDCINPLNRELNNDEP